MFLCESNEIKKKEVIYFTQSTKNKMAIPVAVAVAVFAVTSMVMGPRPIT